MTIECPPAVSYRCCGEMLNVKSVVIKCPLCLFCTDFSQGSSWFRVGYQVPGWNPVGPCGSVGRSKHF